MFHILIGLFIVVYQNVTFKMQYFEFLLGMSTVALIIQLGNTYILRYMSLNSFAALLFFYARYYSGTESAFYLQI